MKFYLITLMMVVLAGCSSNKNQPEEEVSSLVEIPEEELAGNDQTLGTESTHEEVPEELPQALSKDTDGDGISDTNDNCLDSPNNNQEDVDLDSLGDVCDQKDNRDNDRDGLENLNDNCIDIVNADQANFDGDGFGDVCDDDLDGDGVVNDRDNCVGLYNPDQVDVDGNGIGQACEQDSDSDSLIDELDNCVFIPNQNQADYDNDAIGDACDDDLDGDTVQNQHDNCPYNWNSRQEDRDEDGWGDICDTCVDIANQNQINNDNDQYGDACDNCPDVTNNQFDTDRDGLGNECDNCPSIVNPEQYHLEGSSRGLPCDDIDNDERITIEDNCPILFNPDQLDTDADGIGDVCDDDRDDDGTPDTIDNCVNLKNIRQFDLDSDGIGDDCDDDLDGDGVINREDSCLYSLLCTPNDRDGDGITDLDDNCPSYPNSNQEDLDMNRVGNHCEANAMMLILHAQKNIDLFKRFIEHKRNKGISMIFHNISELVNPFGDLLLNPDYWFNKDVEKFRERIKSLKERWNFRYLFILTSPDYVPMLTMYPGGPEYKEEGFLIDPKTDYVYADLDFPFNWDHDEYPGEVEDDILRGLNFGNPDLHVGRIPIDDDETLLTHHLEKIISYDETDEREAHSWKRRALLTAGIILVPGDSIVFANKAKDILEEEAYEVITAYKPKTIRGDYLLSHDNLMNEIFGNFDFGIVEFISHGDSTAFYDGPFGEKYFRIEDLDRLNYLRPFVFISAACMSASSMNSIGVEILKTGAVASFSSTEITFPGPLGTRSRSEYDLFTKLVTDQLSLGDALYQERMTYIDDFVPGGHDYMELYDFSNLVAFNLFGDPTLKARN